MEETPVEPSKRASKPGCCGGSASQAETPKEKEKATEQQSGAQVETKEESCCGG